MIKKQKIDLNMLGMKGYDSGYFVMDSEADTCLQYHENKGEVLIACTTGAILFRVGDIPTIVEELNDLYETYKWRHNNDMSLPTHQKKYNTKYSHISDRQIINAFRQYGSNKKVAEVLGMEYAAVCRKKQILKREGYI